MAVLSDRDIKWYLERGLLKIDPLNGDTIRENGVDLRFGNEFCVLRFTSKEMDTRGSASVDEYYDCVEVGDKGFLINPYEHVLATTAEIVCLPDDLVGLVNLRSTFARLGLLVPPTVIDAGFCGQVTIEIVGSKFPVRVYPGQRFLHLVLVKTTSPVERPYRGRYQGQRGVQLPRLDGV